MKKLLSFVLAAVMILSCVAVSYVATADTQYTNKVLDFDVDTPSVSNVTSYEVTSLNGEKVLKIAPVTNYQSGYVLIPQDWRANNALGIKLTVTAGTAIKLESNGTGLSNSTTAKPDILRTTVVNFNVASQNEGVKLDADASKELYFDFSLIDMSIFDAGDLYFAFSTGPNYEDSYFYISDVEAVYDSEGSLPPSFDKWTLLDGFEDNDISVTSIIGSGYATINTDNVYQGTYALTAGKVVFGNTAASHFSTNYVSYPIPSEVAAKSPRIRVKAKGKLYMGIKINGTVYWNTIGGGTGDTINTTSYITYDYMYKYFFEVDTSAVGDDKNGTGATAKSKILVTPNTVKNATELCFSSYTYYTYGGIGYIDNIEYAALANETEENPTDSNEVAVSMQAGASIRLNAKNGIRFYTTVDAEKIAELKAEDKTVTMGTIIAPADRVTGELTHDIGEGNYIDVEYTANEYYAENTIVGSIVNIKQTNIGREFVGRGYICVDGTYYYAGTNDNARSLKTVSIACQADTKFYDTLTDAQKTLVDGWAAVAEWESAQ